MKILIALAASIAGCWAFGYYFAEAGVPPAFGWAMFCGVQGSRLNRGTPP